MYIGAEPNIANYSMLDAITTSATATYNLTKGGVAFTPENPLGVICSLNGVIQKAGSSFNIVNNTIVFSQALTSNDSIDFILVMGERIDLNVPADASVTNAKTNFVSTSSNAGLQIKGDGTTAGTLQLMCEQGSHGIKIKSPPHSASASYTLTMPNNDGSSGEALTTDGSGVLSWASAGGNMKPSFFAYLNSDQNTNNASNVKVAVDTEVFDSDNKYDNSSNYRFTPTVAGKYMVFANLYIQSSNGYLQHGTLKVYKNGSQHVYSRTSHRNNSGEACAISWSGIIDMDADDYLELYGQGEGGGVASYFKGATDNQCSSFGAYKIIE